MGSTLLLNTGMKIVVFLTTQTKLVAGLGLSKEGRISKLTAAIAVFAITLHTVVVVCAAAPAPKEDVVAKRTKVVRGTATGWAY